MNDQERNAGGREDQSPDSANTERGGERGAAATGRHSRRGGRRGHASQQQQQRPQHQPPRRGENSLNMEELRELTELFTTHGLTDFEFENSEIRVRLSRNPAPQAVAAPPAHFTSTPAAALTHAAAESAAGGATTHASATETPRAEEKAEDLHLVTSPIVGTFYRSPSPDADPFVRVGSSVEPDTVVCIIEAMKLMNEIQSETTGRIEKIYVENGQPVEYGQPLFGVKK